MKDYNFMISDDRLHKTRFCKQGGANQNYPHKEGGWSKRGSLNDFVFFGGGVTKKSGVTFLGGGVHALVPTMGYDKSLYLKSWKYNDHLDGL